ncbi:hypothetical protein AB0383_16735 [Amycolatopsis sp. NPDC051373]|uniref:hypothetical protein n=1 Tax=Amycolatopsis sp. NPDC051373 TaxID=3155801 RepID=UPI00344EFDA7
MPRSTTNPRIPEPYAKRLLSELDEIHTAYSAVLSSSQIINVHPGRDNRNSGMVFIGYATWGWAPSS